MAVWSSGCNFLTQRAQRTQSKEYSQLARHAHVPIRIFIECPCLSFGTSDSNVIFPSKPMWKILTNKKDRGHLRVDTVLAPGSRGRFPVKFRQAFGLGR